MGWRRKGSEVLRFLLRTRCWEYRQLPGIIPLTKPSRIDKARKMGYRKKKGYLVYRVRVRRGNNNKNIPKGKIQGKPSTQGVSQIKPKRNLRVVAEDHIGQKCGIFSIKFILKFEFK